MTLVPAASRSRSGARWVPAVALVFIVVVAVVVIAMSGSSSPTTGYDVSYPQCSGSYPSNPLFGIVGVSGGLANNANRCIGSELPTPTTSSPPWTRATPKLRRGGWTSS